MKLKSKTGLKARRMHLILNVHLLYCLNVLECYQQNRFKCYFLCLHCNFPRFCLPLLIDNVLKTVLWPSLSSLASILANFRIPLSSFPKLSANRSRHADQGDDDTGKQTGSLNFWCFPLSDNSCQF